MKSYQTLLESFELLTEDRIDYLKNQYKDKLSTDHDQLAKHKESDKIIDHFASKADPSTGKVHTQWLIGQYAKKNIRQEDAPQLKATLNDFALVKDNLEKKDLNQYKDVGELRDAITTQKATVEKKEKMIINTVYSYIKVENSKTTKEELKEHYKSILTATTK